MMRAFVTLDRRVFAGPAAVLIKGVHTLAFLAELGAIGWLLVSGALGRRDRTVGVAALMVATESGVFLGNRGVCPLTPLAERYGAARGSVSDIFLPDVMARTIPIWATTLVAVAAGLHARGVWRAWNLSSRRRDSGSSGCSNVVEEAATLSTDARTRVMPCQRL